MQAQEDHLVLRKGYHKQGDIFLGDAAGCSYARKTIPLIEMRVDASHALPKIAVNSIVENFFVKLKDGTLNGSEAILKQIADQVQLDSYQKLVLLDSKFVVVTDPKGTSFSF